MTGKNYVGALVAVAALGSITNSYTTGSVTGIGTCIGGLSGSTSSSISSSYSKVNVTGNTMVGGLVGGFLSASANITSCYTTGSVNGTGNNVGGLVGSLIAGSIINSYAAGSVSGTGSNVGGLVGGISYGSISNSYFNKETTGQSVGVGNNTATATGVTTTELNQLIADGTLPIYTPMDNHNGGSVGITLQVGISSDESSKMSFDTGLSFGTISIDVSSSEKARNAIEELDEYLATLQNKQTELGAVSNRLESVIESIGINIENLTSSQSTIRDADIAEESSEYIRNQILQQAAATLLATANQTPSIALQLL